jgi:16S rRNA processing protein RimM
LKTNKGPDVVVIGKVGSPMGLRGEVRITLYAQDSENLKEGKVLLLKRANKNASADEITAACCGVRMQKNTPVICIEGVTDRTAAENLRGMEIYLSADELDELPEGEHYVRDIIGYTVRDTASGTDIGTLSDVIQNTAQSILDVRTSEGRQVLIPAVDAFMRGIDDEAEVISVELIPGFI